MKQVLLILLTIIIIGCKEKKDEIAEKKSALYNEVMAIHDKIMPEMSTIHTLKRDLKSIENNESKTIIINKIIELDEADEAMMSWMADFKVPDDQSKEEEYLIKEKLSIQNVSDKMFTSITEATSLLDSLKSVKK